MNKQDKITLWICLPIFILSFCGIMFWGISEVTGHNTNQPVDVEYYKAGDVIEPQYNHVISDVLIVTDPEGLNKAIAYEEQGIKDMSEKELRDIFYQYCSIK